MKRYFIVPLIAVLALVFCFGATAYAQEPETTLPDPGITPDSPFYFMDQWGKTLSLAFTFNTAAKAEKALRYADERMAEIEAMMAQNKIREAEKAAEQYQACLQTAEKNMLQTKTEGISLSEQIALQAENHLTITNRIADNASGEGNTVMKQTRETARTSMETALKNMAQYDPEQAAALYLQQMTRQLERVRLESEASQPEGIQLQIEETNRLGNLGQEISQIAQGSGKGPAVDQVVDQATINHLEVLTQIQGQVQNQAQQAVQDAIQNCLETHEQLMTRLQEQDQAGNVPEEMPVINMYQNRTTQSTQTPPDQTQTQTQEQTHEQIQTQLQTGEAAQPASTATQSQIQSQTQIQTYESTQTQSQSMQNADESNDNTASTTSGGQGGSQNGK